MKKKIIISSVLIIIAIICIACLAINSNAENAGGTVEKRKDEETFVRTVASTVRANNTDYTIDAETLADELNRYVGSGKTTVTEQSSDTLIVTFLSTGNSYEVNVNTGTVFEEDIEDITPYIPTGFTKVAAATATRGYTIQDGSGNQYVWVEVPKTTEVYPTAGLSIAEFTSDEYTAIEKDLHTYISVYGNSIADEYAEDEDGNSTTGLTETEYNELKQKMLKSVYQNEGFYVGKYETGTATVRTSESDTLTKTVIQANAYPYNFVRCSQAQTLASGMSSGEYTSSLMFGVQWRLMLKYLETKGAATEAELNKDSTTWGNYNDSLWSVTSTTAKYSTDLGVTYTATPYTKTAVASVLLTTGADSSFSKMGIYDIAGNLWEWVLEHHTFYSNCPCTYLGGSYGYYAGIVTPASYGGCSSSTGVSTGVGFRVSLF